MLIGITGGIGAGKSVVCRILSTIGYTVYDCDLKARHIMENSDAIKHCIRHEIHPDLVDGNGIIDRTRLAAIIFSDDTKRMILNKAVHNAVITDIISLNEHLNPQTIIFVESAIMYTSGLAGHMHEIWEVTAPEDLRIKRVVMRSGLAPKQIKQRIISQSGEFGHPSHKYIVNDGTTPILPQIESLLSGYR